MTTTLTIKDILNPPIFDFYFEKSKPMSAYGEAIRKRILNLLTKFDYSVPKINFEGEGLAGLEKSSFSYYRACQSWEEIDFGILTDEVKNYPNYSKLKVEGDTLQILRWEIWETIRGREERKVRFFYLKTQILEKEVFEDHSEAEKKNL